MDKMEKALREQNVAIRYALTKRGEAEEMAHRIYVEMLEPIKKIYREEIAEAEVVLREAIK